MIQGKDSDSRRLIGKRIRDIRKNLGETQVEFAKNIEISQGYLSDVESGKQVPGGEILLSIYKYTGHSIDAILLDGVKSHSSSKVIDHPKPSIPLFLVPAAAGSPMPGDDHIEAMINPLELLIDPSHSNAPGELFVCRATGDSMVDAGIDTGDYLLCSQRSEPESGQVVVCSLNGELIVKRYETLGGSTQLFSENRNYPPLRIQEGDMFVVYGVVKKVVKSL